MVAQIANTVLLLVLASVASAVKTLNYNVGGPPIGKFCGDPVAFLVSTSSSFEYVNRPKVKTLGLSQAIAHSPVDRISSSFCSQSLRARTRSCSASQRCGRGPSLSASVSLTLRSKTRKFLGASMSIRVSYPTRRFGTQLKTLS
eukprot:IDg4703t1